MAQAVVDPDQLDQFAQELGLFNSGLHEQLLGLKANFDQLSESWHDQERERFADEFEQTTQTLVRFMDAVDEFIPFLQRKSEFIREYQGHQR